MLAKTNGRPLIDPAELSQLLTKRYVFINLWRNISFEPIRDTPLAMCDASSFSASELITFCPVPIFIIPGNYRSKQIKKVCYASDLENFDEEIKKVLTFSNSIKSVTNIVHFDYLVLLQEKKASWEKLISNYQSEKVQFHLEELDSLYSLNHHIQKYIIDSKQSLLVTFTKQNRNWFDRMFLASKTSDMIFDAKTPLLVFRKQSKQDDENNHL
jgi:hypothetical protein